MRTARTAHTYQESHHQKGATMTTIDCKTCRTYLPDLLLDEMATHPSAPVHLAECAACRTELNELRATLALMDEWVAPEPSAYFDSRLHARLREAQAATPEGLWERLASYLQFSSPRFSRSALAGILAILVLLGGGTATTLFLNQGPTPTASSPAVNDLKIYDNNAQALQGMDLLDEPSGDNGGPPQS